MTLQFNIRDLGDGILDSAVILDNLVVTSLEAVDPNPDLLSGDEVTTDVDRLATGGEPVEGAAADGVTRVLLRTTVPGSGQVEFSLDGASAPEDGGLSAVGGTDRQDSVLVPVEETSEGFQAFAVYLVPEEFNRGSDAGLSERPLQLKSRFIPDDGDPTGGGAAVPAGPTAGGPHPRPVVVGRHLDLPAGRGPALRHHRGGLLRQPTPAISPPTGWCPSGSIREALTGLRDEDIAATQVDLAGHSMGGILSRNHISLPTYERPNNFGEGDVHKLLTLNTPHTGSPLANFLVALRDTSGPVQRLLLVSTLRALGMPIDEGAIDDLAKGSAAINAIEQTPVPAHALVGVGGSDLTGDALANARGALGVVFKFLNFIDDTTDLFAGLQHDFVVGRRSQEGGLPSSAISVFDGLESIHVKVTGSTSYSNRVIDLLNTPADSSEFAEFPAPRTLGPVVQSNSLAEMRSLVKDVVPSGLAIVSPADGSSAVAGTPLSVTVAPQNGFDLQRVLILSPVEGLELDQAPFTGNFPVPLDFVGDLKLLALGMDGAGNIATSAPITLSVSAPAALQSVTILNRDPILFGLGTTRQLYVAGRYADGVIRDITDPSTGTRYLAAGPGIASISPSGLVTATGFGITTTVARNGSFQDSVSVTTLGDDVTPPTIVTLSADPDELWPPNHKLVAVTVTVEAVDDTDPQPACAISDVSSNEAADGDFEITGNLTVDLRAERLGQEQDRVYTIEVTCSDAAGNSSVATTDVLVPHDQGV